MSFFGFDTTLPRDRGHPASAPGFSQPPDPFADIRKRQAAAEEEDDDDDALDFEETYDGLGDQLDETDDTFNDDTFGGADVKKASQQAIGKDFDFYSQTAQVSDAMNEEHLRYKLQQVPSKSIGALAAAPVQQPVKPKRTGYERYQEPSYIPDLQASADLWGVPAIRRTDEAPSTHQRQSSSQEGAPPRKMMSLEEVEAAMRAKPKRSAPPTEPSSQGEPALRLSQQPQILQRPHHPPDSFQSRQANVQQPHPQPAPMRQEYRPDQPPSTQGPTFTPQHPPHILQRQPQPQPASRSSPHPRQTVQHPDQLLEQAHSQQPQLSQPSYPAQGSQEVAPNQAAMPLQRPMVTNPQQLLQLTEEERTAYLVEDAKRAKRNHKIYLLSKDNGLMTPQDKNFITRIQLQQLVTATGNPNEQRTDAALLEDFYYQVHSQIRGVPRQNPQQPLNHFAQTYLLQTGGRSGGPGRRMNRPGDNHMQRMEQQVQRAVEAAKLKPKNKQLVIEGSLGKISFSNAKTPKPLLNIKRQESGDASKRPSSAGRVGSDRRVPLAEPSAGDRKSVLKQIESVYSTLMRMEDYERYLSSLSNESDPAKLQELAELKNAVGESNQKLWRDLRIMDPFKPDSSTPHPFIAFLSFAKGKRAIPRIFRHIDQEQRVIILTMVVVHIGILDVVRLAIPKAGEYQLPTALREEVELFSQTVMPSLFGSVNESPLSIAVGLLGILLDRASIGTVARTKIGLSILTMLLSRAEILKQGAKPDEQEWEQWTILYNRLFDALEPILEQVFPGSINSGEDVYVWQFLAAIGLGATPEQQQRLVMAVKDRVMETVMQSRTLPPEMASQRLGNVNLFMRAIGLDVELL
ncbi:MAG: hypothetical protein M1817_005478 [Caeruleum heppii]|nr:MAG: hypothetical protein M1817_005478 [Caeruleum heppii]